MLSALILPTIILTWQAHAYVPAGYQGKILPPRDSTVDVYLEFVDAGKIIPLDTRTIQWTVNGRFLAGGSGLTRLSFPLDQFTTRTYAVTATVKDYNDQDVAKTIVINRTNPLVIFGVPSSVKDAEGTHLNFTAAPFFFSSSNPSDYLFNWFVNGIAAAAQIGNLNVLLPPTNNQQTVSVDVSASNRNNEIESADSRREFIINN